MPGDVRGSPESGAGSGRNSQESFAYFDRQLSLWKMSTPSLFGDSEEFSGTWPRSGTMRNGIAYRQPPLVPRIEGGESSLLLTPHGLSSEQGQGGGEFDKQIRVMYPTPTSTDGTKGGRITERKSREGGSLIEALSARTYLPTPDANFWKTGKRGTGTGGGQQLSEAIFYPTPRAGGRDNCGGSNSRRTAKSNGTYIGRSLNPQFVEWMMGFPLGWTDLEDSETPSSPKSPNGSDIELSSFFND